MTLRMSKMFAKRPASCASCNFVGFLGLPSASLPSTLLVKCEQYWPNEGTELYGDIEVALVEWVEFANYTITTSTSILQVCKVS